MHTVATAHIIAEMLDKFIDKYAKTLTDDEYNKIVNDLIYPLNNIKNTEIDRRKLGDLVRETIATLQSLSGDAGFEKNTKLLQEWLNKDIIEEYYK